MEPDPPPEALLLDTDTALQIVQYWLKKWGWRKDCWFMQFFSLQLTCSHSSAGFSAVYDTLVVGVPPSGLRDEPGRYPSSDIQDALLMWHAVSCCRGFSFQENLSFWLEALDIKLPSTRSICSSIPIVSRPFPRVIVWWDPHEKGRERIGDDNYLKQFHWRALHVFEQRHNLAYAGDTFRYYAKKLVPFVGSDYRWQVPECVLRLRLAEHSETTARLLDAVTTYLREHEASCKEYTDIQTSKNVNAVALHVSVPLTGIGLVGRRHALRGSEGLQSTDFQRIQDFCDALPGHVRVEMRLPTEPPRALASERCGLGVVRMDAFFRRLVGFHGSEFTGRMRVLDLSHAFPMTPRTRGLSLHFETFCTLLPFAVSLEELRIKIGRSADLIWLAYAAFHPSSRAGKWKTLVLEAQQNAEIEWTVLERFVRRKARSSALLELTDEMWKYDGRYKSTPIEPDDGSPFVFRTAILTRRTRVFELSRSLHVVTLPKGTQVEICDVRDSFYQAKVFNRDGTPVIVPGYGVARIKSSGLKSAVISSQELTEPLPKSCLTTLHLGSMELSAENQAIVLRAFGGSLQHLRGHKLQLSSLPPHLGSLGLLTTIDCLEFTPEIVTSIDFSAIKSLQSIGLSCREHEIDAGFAFLHTLGKKLRPSDLRLQIQVDRLDAVSDQVTARVHQLVHGVGSLRRLHVVLMVEEVRYDTPTVAVDESNPGLWRRKLAFLSAVQHAHEQTSLSALGRLDSSLLRAVFAFCGHSVEHIACCLRPNTSFGSAVEPHEMQVEFDAWEDRKVCADSREEYYYSLW